jgi:hypothetical protein
MHRCLLLAAFLFAASAALAAGQEQKPAPPPSPCTVTEQHQLDFWLGDWDLTWPGSEPNTVQHGTNHVIRILDSCVVEENFSGGNDMHLRGKSVSLFDTRSGKWKQTWVDNEGAYLDFVGDFKNNMMTLSRAFTTPDGKPMQQRMIFKNLAGDEFDWSWESSTDQGKTWQVVWPIHYRRHK